MMFWFICAGAFAFFIWFVIQDCDVNSMFWNFIGVNEDKALRGKVAFITGAGSGIGQALALRWASKSVRLALNDFNETALLETKKRCISFGAKEDDVLLLPGDVTVEVNHKKWISNILSKFKQLDILVNNAGRILHGPSAKVPFSTDKAIFDINLMAPVGLTKAALPHFLERHTGYIVQLSSLQGRFPGPMLTAYAASKAAVLSYFTSLKSEVLKDGVSVTVVCPGPVQTHLFANGMKIDGFKAALLKDGPFPPILNGLSTTRCAELISKAMVNKVTEAWISTHPILFFIQFHSWFPSLSQWLITAFFPLVVNLLHGEVQDSKRRCAGKVD